MFTDEGKKKWFMDSTQKLMDEYRWHDIAQRAENFCFHLDQLSSKERSDFLFMLARAHQHKGDYSQALEAFEQSVNLEPGDYDMGIKLGLKAEVHIALGQITEAKKALVDGMYFSRICSSELLQGLIFYEQSRIEVERKTDFLELAIKSMEQERARSNNLLAVKIMFLAKLELINAKIFHPRGRFEELKRDYKEQIYVLNKSPEMEYELNAFRAALANLLAFHMCTDYEEAKRLARMSHAYFYTADRQRLFLPAASRAMAYISNGVNQISMGTFIDDAKKAFEYLPKDQIPAGKWKLRQIVRAEKRALINKKYAY